VNPTFWTVIFAFLTVVAVAIAIWKFREAEGARDKLELARTDLKILRERLERQGTRLLELEASFVELKNGILSYHELITTNPPYGTPLKLPGMRARLFQLVGIEYAGGGLGE